MNITNTVYDLGTKQRNLVKDINEDLNDWEDRYSLVMVIGSGSSNQSERWHFLSTDVRRRADSLQLVCEQMWSPFTNISGTERMLKLRQQLRNRDPSPDQIMLAELSFVSFLSYKLTVILTGTLLSPNLSLTAMGYQEPVKKDLVPYRWCPQAFISYHLLQTEYLYPLKILVLKPYHPHSLIPSVMILGGKAFER